MLQQQITDCCKALKLGSSMAKTCQTIQAESHQEFLYKILLEEIKRRQAEKKMRCLNNAGFYSIKTFEGYSFDEVKLPAALTPELLRQGEFNPLGNCIF